MALVLCTGVDEALLQTRRLILESAGHLVVSVTDEQALITACNAHSFDVAVIGQTVTSKMKTARRFACQAALPCSEDSRTLPTASRSHSEQRRLLDGNSRRCSARTCRPCG